MRSATLIGLLGATLALGCVAGGREADRPPAGANVFEAARLDDTARAFADSLARAVARAPDAGADPARLRAVRARIDDALSGDVVVAAARERFARRTAPAAERTALAFLLSPTGRRLRALERAAEAALADEEETGRMIDAHFAEPVDLDRVALLQRIATAARADALAAGIEAAAERAVARVVAADARHLDASLHRIDDRRRAAAAGWRMRGLVLLQLVYHDATVEELQSYASFAESPAGRWLADASLGLVDDLEAWAAERLSGVAPAPVAAPSR